MTDTDSTESQPLSERGSNRSQRPSSPAFRKFIASGWEGREDTLPEESPAAPFAAARRERLAALFPGERIVVPAGTLVTRSNDTDYRFRPHSAFAHLTGLGTDQEPDAVLVLHPTDGGEQSHEAVLYFRPRAGKDTEEFYADSRYGELWVGERPSLAEVAAVTGLRTAHIDSLADELAKDAGAGGVQVRVVRGVDAAVEA
ncbi:MAG TPA: aminopeptidase P N-terminal domain-containing protein, partial [Phototrophicaceae bacterium]|nr:aminopeptidase P N-terminal domain-containing protein [Phototrophicaceae bacterium]